MGESWYILLLALAASVRWHANRDSWCLALFSRLNPQQGPAYMCTARSTAGRHQLVSLSKQTSTATEAFTHINNSAVPTRRIACIYSGKLSWQTVDKSLVTNPIDSIMKWASQITHWRAVAAPSCHLFADHSAKCRARSVRECWRQRHLWRKRRTSNQNPQQFLIARVCFASNFKMFSLKILDRYQLNFYYNSRIAFVLTATF